MRSLIAEIRHGKRASDALLIWKFGYDVTVRTSFVRTDSCGGEEGKGRLNINLYRTLLKAVNLRIKYFVFQFLLPSPDREIFRKHTKK